jgi:hypothetical protein
MCACANTADHPYLLRSLGRPMVHGRLGSRSVGAVGGPFQRVDGLVPTRVGEVSAGVDWST